MQEKYPWLDPNNERKHISDMEILDKYVVLCKAVMSGLYMHSV